MPEITIPPTLRRHLCAFVALASAATVALAGLGRWTPTGPQGGAIQRISVASDGSQAWAVGTGGIFRSVDGGLSWASLGRTIGLVNFGAVTPDPWREGTVWVATSAGVRRSDDHGLSWVTRNVGLLNPNVSVVVVDLHDPSRLYAVTPSRVFLSVDEGATWQGSPGSPAGVFELVVDPSVPGRLWATANGAPDRVWRSDNGGASWAPHGAGVATGFATGFAVDPTDPDRVWLTTAEGNLYRSENSGNSWAVVATNSDGALLDVVATGVGGGVRLFVNSLRQVSESDNHGTTLTATGLITQDVQRLTVGGGSIWAASLGGLFSRPIAGGAWTRLEGGLSAHTITDLAVGEDTGIRYLTAFPPTENQPGVFRQAGGPWQAVTEPFALPFATAVAAAPGPAEEALLAILGPDDSVLYRNQLGTWAPLASNLPTSTAVNRLVVDPRHPLWRWAAMGGGVYLSQDGGGVWTSRGSGLPEECCPVIEVEVDPRVGGPVYAVISREGVFKSTNNGESWTPARDGLFVDTLALALDRNAPATLFAATSVGEIYRSDDAAGSWSLVSTLEAPVLDILVDPRPGRETVYVATAGLGVLASGDRGATWENLDDGLEWGVVSGLAAQVEQGALTLHALTPGTGLLSHTVVEVELGGTADFSWPESTLGRTIAFTNTSQNLPPGARSSWNFGDGTTSELANPVHTFPAPGTYEVRLSVGVGNSAASRTHTVTVGDHTSPQPCVASATTACLVGGRFAVRVAWTDPTDRSGVGSLVTSSDSSGLFWFFAPANWEMMVKVLDGCAVNQRFWVYSAATTDVAYVLEVEDTVTGVLWSASNPAGTPAAANTDSNAFDTCGSP